MLAVMTTANVPMVFMTGVYAQTLVSAILMRSVRKKYQSLFSGVLSKIKVEQNRLFSD
jgi:hypothetical protein